MKNLEFEENAKVADRLLQFVHHLRLNRKNFAESIDTTSTTMSNILNGRNKPGADLLSNIKKVYPNFNLDWLLLGRGEMYLKSVESKLDIDLERKIKDEIEQEYIEKIKQKDRMINLLMSQLEGTMPGKLLDVNHIPVKGFVFGNTLNSSHHVRM